MVASQWFRVATYNTLRQKQEPRKDFLVSLTPWLIYYSITNVWTQLKLFIDLLLVLLMCPPPQHLSETLS